VKWSDVFLQNNISLQTLWPLLFVKRPFFIAHQTWLKRAGLEHLKRWFSGRATNFAISRAIGENLGYPATTVGNPFNDAVFRENAGVKRERDIVFVGRLVSDKGADVLIDALAILQGKGVAVSATIVGEGPEREALTRRARRVGVESRLTFSGSQTGEDLARLLNAHRLLVVPSRWPEPLGIVALEGIACGCVVIGSSGGGLPEAIGPCGRTFPNGDAQALASATQELLSNDSEFTKLRKGAEVHLARFRRGAVAENYLKLMNAKT
jgi:glycosyltransferase involved in cell wall biosynthesis